jgi:hypothetical protein
MAIHQKYNNENILTRAVIAGILNILNNKITYEQVWSNEDIETIQVPWFYNMSGDERFMQDFYTHYAHCLPPKPVDGNFDMIPRGVITYTGSTIDSARITSRYVQGTYLKEVNGQLQTFRSFLYQIPLNINFDCEMRIDTQITALKIEQAIREAFYKTVTFYVYYKGMRLGCAVGFPEDITLEKNIQYSFETNNPIKINFSLQVEAYQPVFDPTTEVRNDQNMSGIGYRLIDMNMPKNDGIIKMADETVDSYQDGSFPKGYPLFLEWEYIDENAIINKVDILWSNTGENTRNVIEKGVPNNEFYVWNVPQTFTDYKHPVIIWPQDSSVSIYRAPIITIAPNVNDGNKIDASSFYIVDPGYFLSSDPDASANIVLEMRNIDNKVVYSGDTSIYFSLKGNKLDSFTVPGDDVVFPGDFTPKSIDIYVVNSVTSYDDPLVGTNSAESYGVIRNVTII